MSIVLSLNNHSLFVAATEFPGGPQAFLANPKIARNVKAYLQEGVEGNALSLYKALKNASPNPVEPRREQFFTELAIWLLRKKGPDQQIPTQETLEAAAQSGNPACVAAILETIRNL